MPPSSGFAAIAAAAAPTCARGGGGGALSGWAQWQCLANFKCRVHSFWTLFQEALSKKPLENAWNALETLVAVKSDVPGDPPGLSAPTMATPRAPHNVASSLAPSPPQPRRLAADATDATDAKKQANVGYEAME